MSQLGLLGAATPAPPRLTVHVDDGLSWMKAQPSSSFDLVDTDPPYASLELHRAKGTTTRLATSASSSNAWFGILPNAKLPELVSESFRVLRNNRHFYLWCDEPTADVVKRQQFIVDPSGEIVRNYDGSFPCVSGFKFWRSLAWVKTKKAAEDPAGGMGYHYRGAKEWILFFEKGKRKLNDLGVSDVLMAPRPDVDHATPKPWEVNSTLISQSTEPGEVILDPFAGSLSALLAAFRIGRSGVGVEADQEVAQKSVDRLLALGAVDLTLRSRGAP